MAKIVSPVWSSIRGSICGTTYLTTPAGAIIGRQRVKPVNRRSTYQSQVRSGMSAASAQWRAILQAVRDDWSNYALTAGYRSGREAFFAAWGMAEYLNTRFEAGITLTAVAPLVPSKLSLYNVAVGPPAAPGTGLNVSFDSGDSEDALAFICVSPPFAPSRNSWQGPWDQSKSSILAAASPGPWNKDIDLTVDMKYFVRVILIEDDTCLRISTPFIVSGVAETTVV